jgi:hypothetical protein
MQGTLHHVFVADILAPTLAALLDLRQPYPDDDICIARFTIDVREPDDYTDVLHRMLAPWVDAAANNAALKPAALTDEERLEKMSAGEQARYWRHIGKYPLSR